MYIAAWSLFYFPFFLLSFYHSDWDAISRILSVGNAILVSFTSINIIFENELGFAIMGYEDFLKYFRAYLFVDLMFYLAALVAGRSKNDKNTIMTVVHHLVGITSIQAFILCGKYQENAIYYGLTELSTIPLNLAWLFSPQNRELNDPDRYNTLMMIFALLAYISFFVVRIIGSYWLWVFYIPVNLDEILFAPLWQQIFLIFGNLAITTLNFVWFNKMTTLLIKKCSKGKND